MATRARKPIILVAALSISLTKSDIDISTTYIRKNIMKKEKKKRTLLSITLL
jgi:hypothetical protein